MSMGRGIWAGEYICCIVLLYLSAIASAPHSFHTFQKVNNDQGLCNILPWKEQRKPRQVTNKFIWHLSISMHLVVGQFCGPYSTVQPAMPVSSPTRLINIRDIIKYLTKLVFQVCAVELRTEFFPLIYGPSAWAINQWEKMKIYNLQLTDLKLS